MSQLTTNRSCFFAIYRFLFFVDFRAQKIIPLLVYLYCTHKHTTIILARCFRIIQASNRHWGNDYMTTEYDHPKYVNSSLSRPLASCLPRANASFCLTINGFGDGCVTGWCCWTIDDGCAITSYTAIGFTAIGRTTLTRVVATASFVVPVSTPLPVRSRDRYR